MDKAMRTNKQAEAADEPALLANARPGQDLSTRGARLAEMRELIHASPRVQQLKLAKDSSSAHYEEGFRVHGAQVFQRVPLDILEYSGDLGKPREKLDSADTGKLNNSLYDAYVFNDDQYIQMLFANLRVKDPAAFVALDAQYRGFRSLGARGNTGRGKQYIGRGSFGTKLHPIERTIHRFWAGGAMKDSTLSNIMAMHEKVMESREGDEENAVPATPWSHVIWTSGIANRQSGLFGMKKDNPLDAQLEQLGQAGVEVRDMDEIWPTLEREFPGISDKGIGWTKSAKAQMNRGEYQDIKFLSDLVRLIAIYKEGGVYMDTDIGAGSLKLKDHELFHFDKDGQIPHHGPAYRVPADLTRVNQDEELGKTPKERQMAHADKEIPVLNYFLASRSGTSQIRNEIMDFLAQDSLKSGMGTFARMFAPPGTDPATIIANLMSSEKRITPWVNDLEWTTGASQGEG